MQGIFAAINSVFGFIGSLSDFLWDFPTNMEWYRNIPILGNISLAIIVLLGSGIFFTIKLGFIQVTHFKKGIRILTERRTVKTGISPLAAFLLSAAMRVGPGNIIGVTGAIAVGDRERFSGCGFLHFSEWQLPTWRLYWLRSLKRKRMMNL